MMNRTLVITLLALALLYTYGHDTPLTTQAQSGGTYDLTWNTIDGGGGTSTGGNYSLAGTIGQADAGTLTGGAYTLVGGFWGGANTGGSTYTPLIVR